MNGLVFHVDKKYKKEKNEFSKIWRKKTNFIDRLKYAQPKIFCICIDIHKINESSEFKKIFEVVVELKNKKLKSKKILI